MSLLGVPLAKETSHEFARTQNDQTNFPRNFPSQIFYDWRKGYELFEQDGSFAQAKTVFELYAALYSKPCITISWSMGGVFLSFFMDWIERFFEKDVRQELLADSARMSTFETQAAFEKAVLEQTRTRGNAWKDVHVHEWISVAAPFGGTPDAGLTRVYPSVDDTYKLSSVFPWVREGDVRNMWASFASIAALQPQPGSLPRNVGEVVIRQGARRLNASLGRVVDADAEKTLNFSEILLEALRAGVGRERICRLSHVSPIHGASHGPGGLPEARSRF